MLPFVFGNHLNGHVAHSADRVRHADRRSTRNEGDELLGIGAILKRLAVKLNDALGSIPMPPKQQPSFPEFRFMMVALDHLAQLDDQNIMRMAQGDSRKASRPPAKARTALGRSNRYRVARMPDSITIEFLEAIAPEPHRIRLRVTYQLIPPFA